MNEDINKLADLIRNTAYQIHLDFPPGYLEKVYENLLAHRLTKAGIGIEQQYPISVCDKDGFVAGEYIADLIVEKNNRGIKSCLSFDHNPRNATHKLSSRNWNAAWNAY